MTSPRSDNSTGPPPPPEDEGPPAPAEALKMREDAVTKPPPPPRRQTMEVQMAWLDARGEEPRIEHLAAPEKTEETPKTRSVSPISDALQSDAKDIADAFPESDAPTVPRRWPPRLPGAVRSVPPMPSGSRPTKPAPPRPPPPPRRATTEVKMEWVELVEDDLVEEPPSDRAPKPPPRESSPKLPKLHDERASREITRLEDEPAALERIEREKAAALAEAEALLEGPPISVTLLAERAKAEEEAAAAASKKELLSEFLMATSGSVPPGAVRVSEVPPASSDADHDRMREAALADRKREQDARDREILAKRKAERARERIEDEAKRARREQEKREEEDRLAAMRQGTPDKKLLDLSGKDIDNEIDDALDSILGPNLSKPPPAPEEPSEENK